MKQKKCYDDPSIPQQSNRIHKRKYLALSALDKINHASFYNGIGSFLSNVLWLFFPTTASKEFYVIEKLHSQ